MKSPDKNITIAGNLEDEGYLRRKRLYIWVQT